MTVSFEKVTETVELGSPFGTGYTVPRVNLLPPEIAEERQLRRTQGILAIAVVGVLAALGGGYAWSVAGVNAAQDGLNAETARTGTLNAQVAEYDAVPRVLAQVEAAQTARSTAMASDVQWYRYLNDLALTYPKNVWMRDLTVTMAGTPAAGAPTAGAVTDPLVTPGVGTVTFNGTGRVHSDVAAWLDVLGSTAGYGSPTVSQSTRTDIDGTVVVDFTTQVVVTPEALSHLYDRKAS